MVGARFLERLAASSVASTPSFSTDNKLLISRDTSTTPPRTNADHDTAEVDVVSGMNRVDDDIDGTPLNYATHSLCASHTFITTMILQFQAGPNSTLKPQVGSQKGLSTKLNTAQVNGVGAQITTRRKWDKDVEIAKLVINGWIDEQIAKTTRNTGCSVEEWRVFLRSSSEDTVKPWEEIVKRVAATSIKRSKQGIEKLVSNRFGRMGAKARQVHRRVAEAATAR
ncbi:hypothetical protein FRB95_012565 [Tulasnella sp. JGI-2019a]|nr:hypothetical protein FRB95_012565 [Tulasnella sp. JGI-2019a]